MKKKIISVLLACFLICSTCLTSFADSKDARLLDGGIITLPMLAVLTTVAVGTGVVLNNDSDIYKLGKQFYDYIQNKNEMTWDVIKLTFDSCVTVNKDSTIGVKSEFLEILEGFFNSIYKGNDISHIDWCGIVPIVNESNLYSNSILLKYAWKPVSSMEFNVPVNLGFKMRFSGSEVYYDMFGMLVKSGTSKYFQIGYYVDDKFQGRITTGYKDITTVGLICSDYEYANFKILFDGSYQTTNGGKGYISTAIDTMPGTSGYDWNKVREKVKDGGLNLPVGKDLSNLVNKNPSDVWDNTSDLVGNGSIAYPNVLNPSIEVDKDTTFTDTSTDTDTDTDTGTGNPSISFPSFGDALDFSLFELTGITEKFPFSLPWDLRKLIKGFDVEEKAPIFEVPLVGEKIIIDLTYFNDWASITRWFITISFSLGLIFISTKMKG